MQSFVASLVDKQGLCNTMLETFHTGRSRVVLFVHGFNSNVDTFVGDDQRHLFQHLQDNASILEHFDRAQYSYGTSLFRNSFVNHMKRAIRPDAKPLKTAASLSHTVENLQDGFQSLAEKYDDFVLVGHSMGGIVVKSLLTRLSESSRVKVSHFITLGTPHLGIPSISFNQFGKILGNRQFADLSSHNPFLQELNHAWDQIRLSVPHTFFYGLHDTIVPRKYGAPRNDLENCRALDADHFSICRPSETNRELVASLEAIILNSLTSVTWERLSYGTLKTICSDYKEREQLNDRTLVCFSNRIPELQLLEPHIENAASAEVGLLVATTAELNDRDTAALSVAAKKWSVALTFWDRRDLSALSKKYPQVGIQHGLIAVSPVKIPRSAPTLSINSIPESQIINRTRERDFIRRFEESSANALWVFGIAGVGKSVLVAAAVREFLKRYSATGVLRVTPKTDTTEFAKFLNDTFAKAGVHSFKSIYGNSKVSEEDRIATAVSILQQNRLLIVIDNFEAALSDQGDCLISNVLPIIRQLAEEGGKSKVIITSRAPVPKLLNALLRVESLDIEPLVPEQCETEYIPSLPRLSMAIDESEDWSIERVHAVTGGIPLALNLLDRYLSFHTLDEAHRKSSEKFQAYLIETIAGSETTNVFEALQLIAVLEGGVSVSLFEYLELTDVEVNQVAHSQLLSFNQLDNVFHMHTTVREAILKTMAFDKLRQLNLLAAQYLDFEYRGLHKDSKDRHFAERKRLAFLISASDYEGAARLLGRICTRYLSFNSHDELDQIIGRLRSRRLSKKAQAWLLNVDAHMGDFLRAFDETKSLYQKMVELSVDSDDYELASLSISNFATTKRRRGDFNGAIKDYWRAYRIARRDNSRKMVGSCLNNIAQAYAYLYQHEGGDADRVQRIFERAIQVRTMDGDKFRIAATYFHYGAFCITRHRNESNNASNWLERGRSLLRRSLELQVDQENFWLLDRTYEQLALAADLIGDEIKAVEFRSFAETQRLERDIYVSPRFH